MQTSTQVEDWLHIRRVLLRKEKAFTDLAVRALTGEVSTEELSEMRDELMAMRDLCNAVYKKAFPHA